MSFEKLVIVKKKTRLEELLRTYSTTSQVKFVLESRGESYDFYKGEDCSYKAGLDIVISQLPRAFNKQVIDKELLSTHKFSNKDLVIVVGDDGLFVNAAKYVDGRPILFVNPDLKNIEGVLSTCSYQNFKTTLNAAIGGKVETDQLTMAEAVVDDGQRLLAVNDFFIGKAGHTSARYEISFSAIEYSERQSSDGIVISTGTGSTGWLKSIVFGANAIATGQGRLNEDIPFDRDEDYLIYAVMNPFPSKISSANLVYGNIDSDNHLVIRSNMPENGIIFSDGIEDDYIEFNAGSSVRIFPSRDKVSLMRVD